MENRRGSDGMVVKEMRLPGEIPTIETRAEANALVNKEKRYQQILEVLREYGPMTAKEVAVKLMEKGYIPSSERNFTAPRLTEMSYYGLVEPIGKKKCQYSGKKVAVYEVL